VTKRTRSKLYTNVEHNGHSWVALYRDAAGKRRQKAGFENQADANDWRIWKEGEIRRERLRRDTPLHLLGVDEKMTIREAFDAHLARKDAEIRRRPASVDADRWKFEAQIGPEFGDRLVSSLTLDELIAWQSRVVARVSHDYAKTVRRLFSNTMLAARRGGAISVNPFDSDVPKIVKSKVPAPACKERYLTPDEYRRLVDELPARYRALVVVLWETGMRPSEAFALRAEDVSLEGDLVWIDVSRSLTASGAHRSLNEFTKGGRSNRLIPAPIELWDVLEEHIAEFGLGAGGLLFTSPTGRIINANNFRRRQLRPAAERAGIGGDGVNLVPYSFRHSHSSQLQQRKGASVADVAKRLGNSARVVAASYSHAKSQDRSLILGDSLETRRNSGAEIETNVFDLGARRGESAGSA
jgi:integrase